MPLSDQEKTGITQQLATLLEGNEPEAILMTLRRVAERAAFRSTRGLSTREEGLRWQTLADALKHVEDELERHNAPQERINDNAEPNAPQAA